MDNNKIKEKLIRIYESLKQQYDDKSAPIMILSAIEPEDLDFIRKNEQEIVYGYWGGQEWGHMLLTYLIIDFVYENYASFNQTIALYDPIIEHFKNSIILDRKTIIDLTRNTLDRHHFKVIYEKNLHQNTILINSSSRYYSTNFFDYIYKQYTDKLKCDIEYDMKELANTITSEFISNPFKVTQMTNSFGLLIQDKDLFPEIFETVIQKIDQRKRKLLENYLGRWEEAFDDWYDKKEAASHMRSPGELLLRETEDGYYFVFSFPSNKSVPSSNYYIKLWVGNVFLTKKMIPVGKIDNIFCSEKTTMLMPISTIDIFSEIRAVDSTDKLLFHLSASDYRIFTSKNKIVESVTSGPYKIFLKSNLEHNLAVLFRDDISSTVTFINTIIQKDVEYKIGDKIIVVDNSWTNNSIDIVFPNVGNSIATCEGYDNIVPTHPIIKSEYELEKVRIILKRYDGRSIFNDYISISGSLDINELVQPTTDIYQLVLVHNKHRIVSPKYILLNGFNVDTDVDISDGVDGRISYNLEGKKFEMSYHKNEMYSNIKTEIHGKEFNIGLRTPTIFFNPCPYDLENEWIEANPPKFDTNKLAGSISISPGCLSDNTDVHLIIRSTLGSIMIPAIVSNNVCSFYIADELNKIHEQKSTFGLELLYNDCIYQIMSVNTVGKYDVDEQNDIVLVTPYWMPHNCRARYEYITTETVEFGPLELNKTVLLDARPGANIRVLEINLDTNDELMIYGKNIDSFRHEDRERDISSLKPIERANHLLVGDCCNRDVDLAIDILKNESQNGDANATLMLARLYLSGSIVDENLHEAIHYFDLYLIQKK